MKYAIRLPTNRVDVPSEFVTAEAVAEMAGAAEAAGFDAMSVTDHPAPDARWLAAGGHHELDPFVALSFAAAHTSRLRLLTHILVLPYRNPLLAANSIVSLDALSGGRLIVGVAAGYLKAEFRAVGVDFDERNELLDEAIDVMTAVWSSEIWAGEGRHFSARGVRLLPHPVARPRPPIWIGGNSVAAIERAVARGDGWAPFPNPPEAGRAVRTPALSTIEDLEARIDRLHEACDAAGRADVPEICFGPLRSPVGPQAQRCREELERMGELGVGWCTVGADQASTRAEWLDEMGVLASALDLG